MVEYRKIEVDAELLRRIETNRLTVDDTPNSVLRRLLGLPPIEEDRDEEGVVDDHGWSGNGVTLPNGTQLRMTYNGQTDYGEIRDGAWWIDNTRYDTPSGAAGAVARTKQGTIIKLDGWRYWYVKRPGEREWAALAVLRKQAG